MLAIFSWEFFGAAGDRQVAVSRPDSREEFERAVSRRRQSESPEIWIYFKCVEDTSDPGEQLRRVLGFRGEVERRRELLFGRFCTISEWRDTCHDALLKYVLKRVSPGVPEIQSTASPTAPSRLGTTNSSWPSPL